LTAITNDNLPTDSDEDEKAVPRLWLVYSLSTIHDPIEVPLPASGEVELGRRRVLPNKSLGEFVAHRHAKLNVDDCVVTAESLNGKAVFVNGERLTKPRPLIDQDVVRCGDAIFVFDVDGSHDAIDVADRHSLRCCWSGRMRTLWSRLQKVLTRDTTFVLYGPPGSGKEYIAREIHMRSPRRKLGPFIEVDCGALRPELAPSILFGHVKGAFTGAITETRGVFEKAHGGDVFLDEVNAIPSQLQADLLRVLGSRSIRKVGSSDAEVKVDFRAIVATNEDLAAKVKAGELRDDFWSRLGPFLYNVPELAKRRVDLLTILQDRIAEKHGKDAPILRYDAVEGLLLHPWKWNVRELHSVADWLEPSTTVTARSLTDLLGPHRKTLTRADVVAAVDKHGSQTKAAIALGLSQPTISRILNEKS
jgi:transcriptional regulator of acetoin/glycerol metabolism